MNESRPEGLEELGYVNIPDIDTKISSINKTNNMKNQNIDLPSNVAVTEMYSGFLGLGNKKKKAEKKIAKAEKKLAKGNTKASERKQARATKKLTKAERKADRKKRRAERKALRKAGKQLSPDQLADEELDLVEAKEDGDMEDVEAVSDDMPDDEGMPTWAKWTIGITAGAGIIGLATWAITSWIKKAKS